MDATGKRRYHVETIRGTRKVAEAALAERINAFGKGSYVAPSVVTVETYARHWIENIAPASRAASSVHQYASVLRANILPGLGHIELQKLDGTTIDAFYASRRKLGLAPFTMHQIHKLLGQILASAVKAKKLARSPMVDVEAKPKAKRRDKIEVLTRAELAALLDSFRGHWLYMPTLLAASTGLRRGELLGLRWQDIDFKKGTLQVAQAVGQDWSPGRLVASRPRQPAAPHYQITESGSGRTQTPSQRAIRAAPKAWAWREV